MREQKLKGNVKEKGVGRRRRKTIDTNTVIYDWHGDGKKRRKNESEKSKGTVKGTLRNEEELHAAGRICSDGGSQGRQNGKWEKKRGLQ